MVEGYRCTVIGREAAPTHMRLHGLSEPGSLERVRRLFDRQLEQHLHPGAALAIYHGSSLVLDLWSGFADWPRQLPVERDTMFVMYSCTKPLASMSVWLCADRGLIDLDTPIGRYWPAFAKNGKQRVTPRMVLAHTGGFPDWPPQLAWEDLQDWDAVVDAMESAVAIHEPGGTAAYHSFNHGWVCGELVRRVDGRPLPQFFREEIARPLGMEDTYIGPPSELLPRVSKVHPYPDIRSDHIVFVDRFNQPEILTANIPASSGVSTARDIARFYAALVCGGEIDGTRIWSEETARECTSVVFEGFDEQLGMVSRTSAGFMIGGTPDQAQRMGSTTTLHTFGHGGAGTCICWGDTELKVAMAHFPNGYRGDALMTSRNREISDAVRAYARAV
jgi:CubicO group peptidase (beta-lactamase class C family)